jgi:hypothetical protein
MQVFIRLSVQPHSETAKLISINSGTKDSVEQIIFWSLSANYRGLICKYMCREEAYDKTFLACGTCFTYNKQKSTFYLW